MGGGGHMLHSQTLNSATVCMSIFTVFFLVLNCLFLSFSGSCTPKHIATSSEYFFLFSFECQSRRPKVKKITDIILETHN